MSTTPAAPAAPRKIKIYDTWYTYACEKEFKAFTEALWDPTQTVWIEVTDPDSARCGSIGIIVPFGLTDEDRTNWHARPKNKYSYGSTLLDDNFTVSFQDGKSTKMALPKAGFNWLPDYTGPKVWNFKTKEAKPKYVFTDIMGDVIELDDFVAYTNAWGQMSFGHVTKISKVGMIYVTNMKTEKKLHQYETRLKNGEQCCRMTKDIFQRLMLMKLSL